MSHVTIGLPLRVSYGSAYDCSVYACGPSLIQLRLEPQYLATPRAGLSEFVGAGPGRWRQTERMNVNSPARTRAHEWYVVAIFTFGYVLSYVDRQILSLMVSPIQTSLGIGDTQIGLLQGGVFSIFYVIAGVPLARLIDRGHRVNIMSACIALWSCLTAACGLAGSFFQLLLARIGVAVGEAGLPPAVLSMIADKFDRSRVPLVTSIFMMGPPLGNGLALILGAAVYERLAPWDGATLPLIGPVERWQLLFIALGLPGLAYALLIKLTLREPARTGTGSDDAMPAFREVLAVALGNRGFHLIYCLAVASMFMLLYALSSWTPALLSRRHGMSIAELGTSYGLVVVVAGVSGALLAGWLSTRTKDASALHGCLRISLIAASALIVPATCAPLMPSATLSMLFIGLTLLLCSCVISMGPVPIQLTAPNRMRGQLVALLSIVVGLAGAGVGPVGVGLLTDYVFNSPAALPQALAIVGFYASTSCALLLYRAWQLTQAGAIVTAELAIEKV